MRQLLFVGAAALTLFCASPAIAGFVTVSGNAALVSAPATALSETGNIYNVWQESSGVIGSGGVVVDTTGTPGSYTGDSPYTPSSLAANTPYNSTMIQLNPETAGTVHSGEAILTFTSKIIGIALSGASSPTSLGTLGNSDHPYGGSTVYPSAYNPTNNRGIIGHNNDSFSISANGEVLTVRLTANNDGFKELRVFTAGSASGVPEPASLAIWGLVGTVFAGRSLRRRPRPAA